MADPDTIAVIDFETTGMSPAVGARATEIAAVLVRGGRIVGRFASLMRSGARVPPFIEQLIGISNRMLTSAAGHAAEARAGFVIGGRVGADLDHFFKSPTPPRLARPAPQPPKGA